MAIIFETLSSSAGKKVKEMLWVFLDDINGKLGE